MSETIDQERERLKRLESRVILHAYGCDIQRTEPGSGERRTAEQLVDIMYEMAQAQREKIRLLEDEKLALIRRVRELERLYGGGQ